MRLAFTFGRADPPLAGSSSKLIGESPRPRRTVADIAKFINGERLKNG
jgi:hypothetical protein